VNSNARVVLSQALAVCALAIVVHSWATALILVLRIGTPTLVPLYQLILAGVLSFGVARVSRRWRGWRQWLPRQVFAVAAVYITTVHIDAYAGFSLFSIAVYAFCLMAADLADSVWQYIEVRELLTLASVFVGLGLLAAPFAGPLPVLDILFGFSLASFLSLGLVWEHHLETVVKRISTYRAPVWMFLVIILFFAAVVATGRGMFSLRPLLVLGMSLLRDIVTWTLLPIISHLTAAIVAAAQFLLSLFRLDAPEIPEVGGALGERLRQIILEPANPIYLQILGGVFGVVILLVLYVALSEHQRGKSAKHTDEREALQIELRWPKLWNATRRRIKRPQLPREPQNIWDVLRYIELWGEKLARPRHIGETLQEYARALMPLLPQEALAVIVRNFEYCRYRESDLSEAQWQATYAAWAEARVEVARRKQEVTHAQRLGR